jgi:hypothetical protein
VDASVAEVAAQDLGQGDGADVYVGAELLGDREFGPNAGVTLSSGAERSRIENERISEGGGS